MDWWRPLTAQPTRTRAQASRSVSNATGRAPVAANVGQHESTWRYHVPFLIRIVDWLPISKGLKLSWKMELVDRAYVAEIKALRKAGSTARAESVEENHRFELRLIEEDQDQLYTRQLLNQARRLRVPIPRLYQEDGKHSSGWEEGSLLGRWHLTETGIAELREEIRKELRWRFERRAHWVAWLSAITGVLGAFTGLIAVLLK